MLTGNLQVSAQLYAVGEIRITKKARPECNEKVSSQKQFARYPDVFFEYSWGLRALRPKGNGRPIYTWKHVLDISFDVGADASVS